MVRGFLNEHVVRGRFNSSRFWWLVNTSQIYTNRQGVALFEQPSAPPTAPHHCYGPCELANPLSVLWDVAVCYSGLTQEWRSKGFIGMDRLHLFQTVPHKHFSLNRTSFNSYNSCINMIDMCYMAYDEKQQSTAHFPYSFPKKFLKFLLLFTSILFF